MSTLLVGHGLLGAGVVRALQRTGRTPVVAEVPWEDSEAALDALLAAARSASKEAAGRGARWRLLWCAGAGVVATSAEQLSDEVMLVERFVAQVEQPPEAVLLASSAGGVYSGSADPPFTEAHQPVPTSPYGRAKLAIERAVSALAERGSRVAVARYANLYGPGQNLTKPQGLISQLCLSRLTGRPMQVYVSTDTLRDYIYADDAAAVAVAMLDRVAEEPPGTVVTKIVASGKTTSVLGLVSATTRVTRRRPLLVQTSPRPGQQTLDLRMRSVVWTDLDHLVSTPLLVGLRATAEGIAQQHRAARLHAVRR
jgi:UDP-glucose 4-epimerase